MRRSSWACTVLAALAYLGVAAWNFRAVLPDPSALLPESPNLTGDFVRLGRLDQAMVVGVVAGNAHRLWHDPARLRSEGPCHPLPAAYTLGEHMLGEGLLAALPLALGGDPILAYNVLLVATLVIPALGMYALALHFTRSPPAAFVAGLLLALQPVRIHDTGHPFIHGDLWTPLALLFLHLTLARGGLGHALACALFVALAALESLYSLVATVLVLLVYGAYAAFRHRDRARRWAAPLGAAALAVALLCERWVPALARATFGSPLDLVAYRARPPDEDVRLLRAHAHGALLDLPYPDRERGRVLLGGRPARERYGPHPTAACYNSFPSPIQPQVAALANGLPDPAAADALSALGFGTVLVHAERASPRGPGRFAHRVEHDPAIAARLTLAGRTERLLAFRLRRPIEIRRDVTQLGPAAVAAAPVLEAGRRWIAVPLRNASAQTFGHPDPIAPSAVEARWRGASGDVVRVERVRTVLPLALAAGATAALDVELETPPPGTYDLTLHAPSLPEHELARLPVVVTGGHASRIDTRDARW